MLIIFTFQCTNKETVKEYFNNGNVKTLYHLRNNEMHGLYKEFYPNGRIKEIATFIRGKYEGERKFFYKNGKLRTKYFYINDTAQGKFYEYDSLGNLYRVSEIKDNLQHGITKFFYKDGKIKTEEKFANGQNDGYYRSYYQNGELSLEAMIKNDQTEYYIDYDSLGNIIEEERRILFTPEPDTIYLGDIYSTNILVGGPAFIDSITIVFYLFTTKMHFNKEYRALKNDFTFTYLPDTVGYYNFNVNIRTKDTLWDGNTGFRVIDTTLAGADL